MFGDVLLPGIRSIAESKGCRIDFNMFSDYILSKKNKTATISKEKCYSFMDKEEYRKLKEYIESECDGLIGQD